MRSKLPVPTDVRGRETSGRVTQLQRGRLCGVIRARDGQSVFFHRSDLIGLKYNDMVVGTAVRFELVADAISGPRAVRVRAASAKGARSRPADDAAQSESAS